MWIEALSAWRLPLSGIMLSKRSRWVLAAGIAHALWVNPLVANAQTTAILTPADSSSVRELRVAFASSNQRSSLWLSLRVDGGAKTLHVVVPAPVGAQVDWTTDAWFEALATATTTRILPPTTPPACGTTPKQGEIEVVGDNSHENTLQPEPTASVRTLAELVVWAKDTGLALTAEQMVALADLEAKANRFVTVEFALPVGESVTRTIRVTSPSAGASLPLFVSPEGSEKVALSAWIIGPSRARPKDLPGLEMDAAQLRWIPDSTSAHSNYWTVAASLLDKANGDAWMVDFAGHKQLFRDLTLADGAASIPSVAATYFERASGYGDTGGDCSAFLGRFSGLENAQARVGMACGRGALATVGGSGSCQEVTGPGETMPDQIRCGPSADDLAIALSGAVPAEAWLTHWTGYIRSGEQRVAATIEFRSGDDIPPVAQCTQYELTCQSDAGSDAGSVAVGPDSGTGSGSPDAGGSKSDAGSTWNGWAGSGGAPSFGWGGSGGAPSFGWGGSTEGNGSQMLEEDDTDYDDSRYYSGGGEIGCSSSSSGTGDSSSDSCSGDSSSSSSSDDDSCSGDSTDSGTSDSDGDSCSGDSTDSSSSDSDGDSCSGGSSGASGSSSSDPDGDSCSGGSSGASGSDSDCSVCKTHRRLKHRPPTSATTLGLVAVLLPLRRWARRRRPGGESTANAG